MTPDERRRLAAALRGTRDAGWTVKHYKRLGYYEISNDLGLVVTVNVHESGVEIEAYDVAHRLYCGWPRSVQQALNVLAAIGFLPDSFSGSYDVGREAATAEFEVEWSARMKSGRAAFASTFTEGGARRYASQDPSTVVMCRRVGPWEVAPDAAPGDQRWAIRYQVRTGGPWYPHGVYTTQPEAEKRAAELQGRGYHVQMTPQGPETVEGVSDAVR